MSRSLLSRLPGPGGILMLSLVAALIPGCAREDAARHSPPVVPDPVMSNFKPLSEILAQSRDIVPGREINVELETDVDLDDDGREVRWVYEIEILTGNNRVVELEFDAVTGQLLEVDGAPWPAHIPRPQP